MTLAEYREWHGITQPEMAQRLGVSAQSISRWERGIVAPRLHMIKKIEQDTQGKVTIDDWPDEKAA